MLDKYRLLDDEDRLLFDGVISAIAKDGRADRRSAGGYRPSANYTRRGSGARVRSAARRHLRP